LKLRPFSGPMAPSVLSGDRALGSAGAGLRLRRHLEHLGPVRSRHALQILVLCAVMAFTIGWSSQLLTGRQTAPEPQDWDAVVYAWLRPPPTPEPLTFPEKAMDFAQEHLSKAAVPAGRALRALRGALLPPSDPEITLPGFFDKPNKPSEEDTGAGISKVGRTIRMLEIGAVFGALVAVAVIMSKRHTKPAAPLLAGSPGTREEKGRRFEGSSEIPSDAAREQKIRIIAGSKVVEVRRPSLPNSRPLPGPLARDGGLCAARSSVGQVRSPVTRLRNL